MTRNQIKFSEGNKEAIERLKNNALLNNTLHGLTPSEQAVLDFKEYYINSLHNHLPGNAIIAEIIKITEILHSEFIIQTQKTKTGI